MNDMTVMLDAVDDVSQPFAAIFSIERDLFKQHQSNTLDLLERGSIRFSHKQSFDPFEHTIDASYRSEDLKQVKVSGAMLSLTGANGILPSHYSETMAKSLRDKNLVLKDFLDMFNHRVNSLMYRSWTKYRLDTDKYYQSHVKQHQSIYDLIMTSFSGETFPRQERSAAYYSGLMFASTQSTEKLKGVIKDLTGLAISINEFKGKWIELSDDQLSRMNSKKRGQAFNQLGIDSMLGRRCWDLSSSFEVEFEVDDAETFKNLAPGGSMNKLLNNVIKKFAGVTFDFNFKLKVKAEHCEKVKLSRQSKNTKLGASAWMGQTNQPDKIINYYC